MVDLNDLMHDKRPTGGCFQCSAIVWHRGAICLARLQQALDAAREEEQAPPVRG